MSTMQKILELLITQIGYKENGTNITKYAEYFDTTAWQFFNTKKQGAQWCALLIIWAYCQVLGTDKTREFLGLPKPADNCAAGCKFFFEYLDKKGYKVAKSKGQAGDIIFFNTSKAKCAHVGFIEKVDDEKYYTIEGNKSDRVKRCSYVKNSTLIYAICQPDYSSLESGAPVEEPKPVEPTPIPAPAPAPTPTPEPSKTTTTYRVKTINPGNSLNLRTKPVIDPSNIVTSIKDGTEIEVVSISDGWAKCIYKGRTVFCTSKRLQKA